MAILAFMSASAAFADGSPAAVSISSATARQAPATPPEPRRLSLGVNYTGGQLRLHATPNWAGEARFQTGSASSNEGSIHSLVFGLRGYRFFDEFHRCRIYLGLEGDYAKTSIRSVNFNGGNNSITNVPDFGNTSGYAAGGFGGIELRIFRRVYFDIDMGPYLIGLKEKTTGTSNSNWDFVVDTALNIYLF